MSWFKWGKKRTGKEILEAQEQLVSKLSSMPEVIVGKPDYGVKKPRFRQIVGGGIPQSAKAIILSTGEIRKRQPDGTFDIDLWSYFFAVLAYTEDEI